MARRKFRYPGTEEAERQRNAYKKHPAEIDEEPDILCTAGGFAPNYSKFEAMGMSAEEALVWCNMD